ncbi:MAG TPA: GNAT family N-acetyltransferase [Thermoanaerobaculia bacterium]|jgi:chorismate synthase
MTRITIRELHDLEDFGRVQDVARLVWGFDDRKLPATADLQAVTHVGGMTAGAFAGREMVGFVHGLPRTNLPQKCHHSHMLAVRPEWRGRDVSVRLKLFQRAWCLARGIRLVTWTYDPLLVRNATLNLVRLRGRAVCYLPDHYGPLGGLYGDLPTDRFEVHWRLEAPEVRRAAAGAAPEPLSPRDAAALPAATSARIPASRRVAVDMPAGAPELSATNPKAARRAQDRLRRIATRLFARGFEATAIAVAGDGARYVFERR